MFKPSQLIPLENDNNPRVLPYYTTTVRYFAYGVVKFHLKSNNNVGIKRLLSAVEVTAAGYGFYCWLKKTQKGQNQIKTEQKQEAWRSREKSEAVTVDKGRKTEENAKRWAGNANTCKVYSSFKRRKKRKGAKLHFKECLNIDSFNDIHSYFDDDPLSGSTTFSANSLLEEFTDELALITYPPDYDDNHSIDQSVLTHCDDLFVDHTPEMFTDEQPPDYSFPPRFDVYPDDFLEIKSDATFDDDSFDSKGEKIKESELLIGQLDLPCDILLEYDSFNSQDFSRDDVLPSPDNEDKVFNPRILIHEKSVKIITRFAQEKKLVVSYASWLFEDFDPPFSELLVFKEVPNSMRLLPFSSKNEEKVFKPGIYTSKKFHCCFLPELSHL
nr:hypothetical protein [Tanacetum cinerariifolium]